MSMQGMAMSVLHLLLNIVLLAGASHVLTRWAVRGRRCDVLRYGSVFGLIAVTVITVPCVLLGYAGLLSKYSLTVAVALVWATGYYSGRRWGFLEPGFLAGLFVEVLAYLRGLKRIYRLLLLVLLLPLGLLFFEAAVTPPMDFDSHGYRLSRIGLWLQEGALWQLPTTDPRMNYSAINGDLVMLWLTAPFEVGYPLAKLAQYFGGLYLMVVCAAFARALGVRRRLLLLVPFLLLSGPVVYAQMATTQVDLFVGVMLASGLFFLMQSLRGRESPWLAWLGIAQAVAVKGTLFYMGPGLAAMGLLWLWLFRPGWRHLKAQAIAASVCLLVVASPRYLENQFQYGNPFASSGHLKKLHRTDDSALGGFSSEKLTLNLSTYFAQNFVRDFNPPVLAEVLLPLSNLLIDAQPSALDEHVLNTARGPYLRYTNIGKYEHPHALTGSLGLLLPGLAFAGIVWSGIRYRRRRLVTGVVLTLAFAGLTFVLLLSGFYIWTPYKFRYFMLLLPALVLPALLLLQWSGSRVRRVLFWGVVVLSLASVGKTFFTSSLGGWHALMQDYRLMLPIKIIEGRRGMLEEEVVPGSRIAVSQSYYGFLSPFFRTGKELDTVLVPRDELRQLGSPSAVLAKYDADYLFTPVNFFESGEAGVYSRWFNGLDKNHVGQNFILHRMLEPDEVQRGFVTKDVTVQVKADTIVRHIRVVSHEVGSVATIQLLCKAEGGVRLLVNVDGDEERKLAYVLPANRPSKIQLAVKEKVTDLKVLMKFKRELRVDEERVVVISLDGYAPLLEVD